MRSVPMLLSLIVLISDVLLVFGPEDSGLSNPEVALCDTVVTIPTSESFLSLNLAQAVMVTAYEVHMALRTLEAQPSREEKVRPGQKERIIHHLIQVAYEVGFILPGDPFKMQSRLEQLLADVPPCLQEARLIHGFMDQISRSMKKGQPDFRGRYAKRRRELMSHDVVADRD